MVRKQRDTNERLDRLESLLERLLAGAVQTQDKVPTPSIQAQVVTAKAQKPSVKLPASAELNALQGQCRPVAARIVEKHAKAGIADMTAYVAKLQEFQSPTYKSPRFQYACAMLSAISDGKPTPARSAVGLRKPNSLDKLTPRKAKQTAQLADIAASGVKVRKPKDGASNADWQAYLETTQPDFGSLGRSGRWHRADAARKAAAS